MIGLLADHDRRWTTDEVEQPLWRGSCCFVSAHGRPRDEEPGSRCKLGRAVFTAVPPLRHPWVPVECVGSSPRSGAGRRPQPARRAAAPPGGRASGCCCRQFRADHVAPVRPNAVPAPATSWRQAPDAPSRGQQARGSDAEGKSVSRPIRGVVIPPRKQVPGDHGELARDRYRRDVWPTPDRDALEEGT
jgi:hypothetical protein